MSPDTLSLSLTEINGFGSQNIQEFPWLLLLPVLVNLSVFTAYSSPEANIQPGQCEES